VFLNVRNGAFAGSEDMTDFVESTPAIDAAGVIYLADTDGFLDALDRAAGRSVWTRQIAGFASFEGSPAIANRVMLIGNTDGVLRAIDTRNGNILWRRQQEMASSTPALAAGMVIAQGTSGDLTAYAPA
jgi:outer membrane protein assembly factor BamB